MSAEPCILLLRGVNVGGHRLLPMEGLRALLTGLGLEAVQTHIQSGNAVFRAPAPDGLAAAIPAAIAERFGFAPEALILRRAALDRVLAQNPFAQADPGRVQIGFLARPSLTDPARLTALATPDEGCALTLDAFYLHAPTIGRSRLAQQAERLLGVPMTMRNLRVATALATLAQRL